MSMNGNGKGLIAMILVAVLAGIAVATSFLCVAAVYREGNEIRRNEEERDRALRNSIDERIRVLVEEDRRLDRDLRVLTQTYYEDPKDKLTKREGTP